MPGGAGLGHVFWMKRTFFAAAAAFALAVPAAAQPVDRGGRSIAEAAAKLKSGEYVWAPELAPDGPALVIVNIETQRLILFRNGVPVAASTVSTGKTGHETPTGVFTVLEKRKEHYSSTYNNAPMPNMQRLTWKGIALHAGKLPGYPASHGCIRLPMAFSALLFGATERGMTVVITSIPAVPRGSIAPDVASGSKGTGQSLDRAPYQWHRERSSEGMVSVVVSAADQRASVLQGGVEIGSAPVRVTGSLGGGQAYVLRSNDGSGQKWLRLQFSGAGQGMEVSAEEARRFEAPIQFRRDLASLLQPGSVIIVTPESLRAGSTGSELTVIENEESKLD